MVVHVMSQFGRYRSNGMNVNMSLRATKFVPLLSNFKFISESSFTSLSSVCVAMKRRKGEQRKRGKNVTHNEMDGILLHALLSCICLLSVSLISFQMECVICSGPPVYAHLGVNACRACAVFYKLVKRFLFRNPRMNYFQTHCRIKNGSQMQDWDYRLHGTE